MRAMIGVLIVLAAGLTMAGATSSASSGPQEGTVPFGLGSIEGLSPGDSCIYRMVMNADWAVPYSGMPLRGTKTAYVRVLVTDVLKVEDGVRVKARMDCVDEAGKVVVYKEAYNLVMAHQGQRAKITLLTGPGLPHGTASMNMSNGVPCPLLGYPELTQVPVGKATDPLVQGRKAGAVAVRYAPSYDGKAGLVKVNVGFFRNAREGDQEKGKEILYLAPEPDRLLTSVPMGEQAGPLFTALDGYPRDKYGEASKYKVWPVTVQQTEEQEWEPGAAFPKHILCRDEKGMFLFELTLLRKEKVALEPEPAPAASDTPAGAAAGGTSPAK